MKISGFVSCIVVSLVLQFPLHGWAQKKQLTPVSIPTKIAFLDIAKIRSGYKAYNEAKDSLFKSAMANRKDFETARQQLYLESKNQLKKDSSAGGKQKDLIVSNTNIKQNELESKYRAEIRQRRQKGQVMINDYEAKISAAIRSVMAKGVYTEMKPLKESSGIIGTDITGLVLQILNK
jgi:hypothetical protein